MNILVDWVPQKTTLTKKNTFFKQCFVCRAGQHNEHCTCPPPPAVKEPQAKGTARGFAETDCEHGLPEKDAKTLLFMHAMLGIQGTVVYGSIANMGCVKKRRNYE